MGETQLIKRSNRRSFFKVGGLHFGMHGLLGFSSLSLTILAYYSYPSEYPIWIGLSQVANLVTVTHARNLLSQVPASTQIFPGIVAPHKEAFQRTISGMQYLVTRVTCLVFRDHSMDIGFRSTLALLLWRAWPLIPSYQAEWLNGNTWIFVIPMALGVAGDLIQFWNGDVFSSRQILSIQLHGLLMAFGFTLGFRNYLPMPLVYMGAAFGVWKILREGIMTFENASRERLASRMELYALPE